MEICNRVVSSLPSSHKTLFSLLFSTAAGNFDAMVPTVVPSLLAAVQELCFFSSPFTSKVSFALRSSIHKFEERAFRIFESRS